MYEYIGQNRVSAFLIRDQNRLLAPRYESRYMKDSLSYRGASLWNFVNYNDMERLNNFRVKQILHRVDSLICTPQK